MGLPVLILGKSGSGKSASLRSFDPEEVAIFNVASKPLPFRGGANFKMINGDNYEKIEKSLMRCKVNTYVIDDSQYLMAFDSFNRANDTGFKKFTDIAVNFYSLLKVVRMLPADCIVYLLHHVETNGETGEVKAKTIGKMIDQQLTLEGLFSIVLLAEFKDGEYTFSTKTDGLTPTKTPMGMFETEHIENDLRRVDDVIREYYGLGKRRRFANGNVTEKGANATEKDTIKADNTKKGSIENEQN